MHLVIVESPGKCKKLSQFLGKDYRVVASVGHFRDLPIKGLGLQLDTMDAEYVISKKDVVERLKKEAKHSDIIYLCTDPDREGEAISWHLKQVLPQDKIYRRATFQEVTKKAVLKAIENYGDIHQDLTNAQQARRILDRLVGYKLSPELWKNIKGKSSLSAGRVQSVATRLIVDREREIESFKVETYYKIFSHHSKDSCPFKAELKFHSANKKNIKLKDEKETQQILESLKSSSFTVQSIEQKEQTKKPQAPFTTSNMQAKAAFTLKMSADKSMKLAQSLYESGHITYHRTDSVSISKDALAELREYILSNFGDAYLPKTPQKYHSKSNAQEAHECIRPTSITNEKPNGISPDAQKLYSLIRMQYISSQMQSGKDALTTVLIAAGDYLFEAKGRVITFDGFRKLNKSEVQEKSRKKKEQEDDEKQKLPKLNQGEVLNLEKLESKKLKTKPPPRYSEASLIKKLENEGIGRPSTYATIVSTIVKRGYVHLNKRMYHADELGKEVTDFLVYKFPKVMELGFTKACETRLDLIGEGKLEYREFLKNFWAYLKQQIYLSSFSQATPKCPSCGRATQFQESKKWKGRFFYCCHTCQCYLESLSNRSIPKSKSWIQKK